MATARYERLKINLGRVDSLLALYDVLHRDEVSPLFSKQDARAADVLRAAVVLLHGSQEDYIRGTISDLLLAKADPKELETISLLNKTKKSPQKFTMADLVQHKDMTVADLIQKSMEDQLCLVSFNKYSEVCAWLDTIGVSLEAFKRQELIENLIKRRHAIVHEVDKNGVSGKTTSISAGTVRSWREAVETMLGIVDQQVDSWSTATSHIDVR